MKLNIRVIAGILIVISSINIVFNIKVTKKIEFDKVQAEGVLRQAYKPLEDFIEDTTFIKEEKLLEIPWAIYFLRLKKDRLKKFIRN